MSLKLILEVLELIALVSFGFFVIGTVIPVGYTLGSVISDNLESFLRRF